MGWIPVERELPEDFQTVLISGECNGLRAVNISFRKNNEWVRTFDWKPWNVNVEAWMPMPFPYLEGHRDPKGPPGFPGYLLHPWTGEKVYGYDVEKYMALFEKE